MNPLVIFVNRHYVTLRNIVVRLIPGNNTTEDMNHEPRERSSVLRRTVFDTASAVKIRSPAAFLSSVN